MDHVDREISVAEQGWCSPIKRKALAKIWGMKRLRANLSYKQFMTFGNFWTISSIFNNTATPTSITIDNLHKKVQDMDITENNIPRKDNPCNYSSREPTGIQQSTKAEHNSLGIDKITTS